MTLPAFFLPAIANNVTTAQLVGAIGAADVTVALKSGHGALLPSISRGDASSTGDSMTLNDTGALGGLAVGDPLYNLTDGSHCVVTSIASAPNSVRTTPLEGGSDNTWQSGDVWVKGAYVVTVVHYDTDGVTVLKRERMLVTNRVTDTLTVVRGYDSDTPQTFSANDYVQILVEKSIIENVQKGLRNVVQKIQDIWRGTPWYITTTGSSNAYAAAIPNVSVMTDLVGVTLALKANFGNTGSATLNVNGIGAQTIKKLGGTADLASGDIPNGMLFKVVWEGTYFQMTTPPGQAPNALTMADIGFFGTGADGAVTWSAPTNLNPATNYNYTTSVLDASQTLSVSSVNSPLIIRSTGNVTINGTVDLDGKGGAGGTAGVDTGSTGSAGGNGTDGASLFTGIVAPGGGGGGGNVIGGGGGGGASFKTAGSNGTTGSGGTSGSAGSGGAAPSAAELAMMANLLSSVMCGGGGGGGGGSGNGNGMVGGNGGGAMIWFIGGNLTLGNGSVIRCRGTAASGGTGTGSGGAGGGAGGMIIIIVKGTITDNGATLQATAGNAGSGIGGGGTGGNGGAAGAGRVMIRSLTTKTALIA